MIVNANANTSPTQSMNDPWAVTITTITVSSGSAPSNVIYFSFPDSAGISNDLLIDPELFKKPDPYWAWTPYAPPRVWMSQTRFLGAPHSGVRARRRIGREPRRCGRARGSWRRRARR